MSTLSAKSTQKPLDSEGGSRVACSTLAPPAPSSVIQVPDASHPGYATTMRLRGYTGGPRRPDQMLTAADVGKALIKAWPAWTREDHLQLAAAHRVKVAEHDHAWGVAVEAAMQETFHRSYTITDYKVSGIAREEFSPERKDQLRSHAHAGTRHSILAAGHEAAAKVRNRYKG